VRKGGLGKQRDKQLESEHFLLMPFAHFFLSSFFPLFFVLYCITFALPENIKNNAHRKGLDSSWQHYIRPEDENCFEENS